MCEILGGVATMLSPYIVYLVSETLGGVATMLSPYIVYLHGK